MLKIYSVRDVKADAYGSLMCVATIGLAMRVFADACSDPRGPLAQYPEDYNLYELGTFDPAAGTVFGYKVPKFVASASQTIATHRAAEESKRAVLETKLPLEVKS